MKTAVVLCFITYTIESISALNGSFRPDLKQVYPKKANPIMHKSLKLMNRRFEKKTESPETELGPTKRQAASEYTLFPPQANNNYNGYNKAMDVPSSPYFPNLHDGQDEPKLRVKKVLPDFWSVRRKRSPDVEVSTKIDEISSTTAVAVTEEKKPEEVVTSDISSTVTATATATVEAVTEVTTISTSPTVSEVTSSDTKVTTASEKATERTTISTTDDTTTNTPNPSLRSGGKSTRKAKSKSKVARSKTSKDTKPKQKRNSKPKRAARKDSKKSVKRTSNRTARAGKVKASRRLIAARDALIENYPYVVSIQKEEEHWCSGALLNQRLVITTANCVWKSSTMSRLKIRAGSRHLDYGGQTARIAQVMKHPSWTIRTGPDNDVALLLTDVTIKFSHSCHGVDLPNRIMMPVFDDAWIVSWGAERRDGIYVKQGLTLQVYHARLLNRDKCNNITMRFGVHVSENFICLEQTGRRAPCTRDTGAPAVSDGVLWGLASWGLRKPCGTERFPAMFSYLASETNMDFIINATHYLMSDQRESPFLDRFPAQRVAVSKTYSK